MNDKKHYTLEELVNNSEFIHWVQTDMPSNSNWTNIKSDQSDFESIKSQAIEMVQGIRFKEETNTKAVKDSVWSKIDGAISKEDKSSQAEIKTIPKSTKTGSKIRPLYWLGAAAAACLFILFMVNPGDTATGITNIQAADAIVNQTLPDKSTIELTPGSHVSYDESGWLENRSITLNGEAFFNVQKGESFTVETNNATVVVLGTSFNIKETENNTEVICKTGKVKVISKLSQTEEIITANQLVNVSASKLTKKVHSSIFIPWKEDSFSFDNMTLQDVFADIETTFNVNIDIPAEHLNTEFTGDFEKSKLEEALYNICWPMKLKYTIEGSQVSIQSTE